MFHWGGNESPGTGADVVEVLRSWTADLADPGRFFSLTGRAGFPMLANQQTKRQFATGKQALAPQWSQKPNKSREFSLERRRSRITAGSERLQSQ